MAGQAVELVKHNGKIVKLFEVDVHLSGYLFQQAEPWRQY
jgi:hypothetical protein